MSNSIFTIEELIWRKDAGAIRKRLVFVSILGICEGMTIVFTIMLVLKVG